MATHGSNATTLERVVALEATKPLGHIFALGESVGSAVAVQSAAVEPRIEGVVAEASFGNSLEAYDYAGLRRSPLLGKSLLATGGWTMILRSGPRRCRLFPGHTPPSWSDTRPPNSTGAFSLSTTVLTANQTGLAKGG